MNSVLSASQLRLLSLFTFNFDYIVLETELNPFQEVWYCILLRDDWLEVFQCK